MKLDDRFSEKYGDSAFALGQIKFWLVGRRLPESEDAWEKNLLDIVIAIDSAHSSAIAGEVIERDRIDDWVKQIQALLDGQTKQTTLSSLEEVIQISLESGKLGNFLGTCELRPADTNEAHTYQLELDRFNLQSFVNYSKNATAEFPLLK